MSDSPISSHLDRDTLIKLAGWSTIGNPVAEVQARLDGDTE